MKERTFLQELLNKKAMVLRAAEVTGKPMTGALLELDRQIKQCLQGGDLVKDEGVTKSGEED